MKTLALALVIAPFAPSAQAQNPSPVVTGVPVHVAQPAKQDTVVYRRSITQAGRDTAAGTRTVVLRAVDAPGGRLLEVVQRFPGGGGEIVDTAVADLATLRAVSHSSHQPSRTMLFRFVDSRAEGTVTTVRAPGDTTPPVQSVRQELGGPIFDSNVIDMVVAGLPLAPRFSTELPFFIYERGGRVPMAVSVRERATESFLVGRRDAWVVGVSVPGAPATVWVDARTHAVLRVRYDITARSMSFTDERVTPLPL